MNKKPILKPILAIMGIFLTLLIIVGTILIVQHFIHTDTPPEDTTTTEKKEPEESTTPSTPGEDEIDNGQDNDNEQGVGGLLFCGF